MERLNSVCSGGGPGERRACSLGRVGLGPSFLVVLLWAAMLWGPAAFAQSVRVSRGAVSTEPVTPVVLNVDLSKVAVAPVWKRGQSIRMVPKSFHGHPKLLDYLAKLPAAKPALDPLLAVQEAAPTRRAFTTPLQNFPGQPFSGVYPPDTTLAVGPNYVIQATNGSNTTYTIHNKVTGAVAAGPIVFGSLFSDPSNDCATSGGGDPILLFDHQAQRWLISEFTSPFVGNFFCVYISQTSDPITGGWYSYQFEAVQFPDYPKYGVWHDGYYVGTNEGTPRVYAMQRSAMLTGAAATMQTQNIAPSLAGFGFQMVTPANAEGATPPPASRPATFVRHRDDEVHNAGSNNKTEDYLDIFTFDVDFANPANTTLTGPVSLAIAEFDSDLCGLTSFSCIEQPSASAPGLDPLREVVMWALQYRNIGGVEKLVGSQTTDVNGADRAGVRWWELRSAGGGAWAVEQEGTYAPSGDSHSRWMPSVSSDTSGNIAVGYSVGSSSLSAGIRYSGRLSSDPAGTLTQAETIIQSGSGSQNFDRWGDYSAMFVDPVDGCTFWYTNEYVQASGNWATQIASFAFDACGEPGFSLSGSNLVQTVCSPSPLTDIPLSVNGVGGFADPVTLSFVGLSGGFSGSFSTNPVTPSGTSTASVGITLPPSVVGVQNFLIQGTASGAPDREVPVDVIVSVEVPNVPILDAPAGGAVTLSDTPLLVWESDIRAENFVVEVDDDPAFGSIDYSANTGTVPRHLVATPLNSNTTYSWRVRASNACGNASSASEVRTFRTPSALCRNPALAIPDNGPAATDSLVVADSFVVEDLEASLKISHTYVGDLSVTLSHVETGTSVLLVDRPGLPALGNFGCSRDNIDVVLSDAGTGSVEDQCEVTTPAISGVRTPDNPLSAFDNESTAGTWQLSVEDGAAADSGTLVEWCLLVPEPGSTMMLLSGILFLWAERRVRGQQSRSRG